MTTPLRGDRVEAPLRGDRVEAPLRGDGPSDWPGEWTSSPAAAHVADGTLHVTTQDRTDFWQGTFYGFHRDDGHALLRPAPEGDFSVTLTFDGAYDHLYDQAGLMLRASPTAWIKFGIEWTDGAAHLSVVVTDGRSDWSAQPVALDGPVTVRATRLGDAALLQWRDGPDYRMARLAPLPDGPLRVGPYCASPERAGFEARFLSVAVGAPEVTALHA